MTRRLRPAPALAAALLLGPLLGGCISLLPKQPPSQLYRFAAERGTGAPVADASAAGRVALILPPVTLSRASSGDQILTVTGDETAFIAGARWVSPAAVLWEESVRGAFAGRSVRTRLLTRTEVGTGQAFLRLTVPVFEARYARPDAPPVVTVRLNAILLHRAGPFVAERSFTAETPAAENRAGAVVAAYDQAVERITTELVAWTDANAAVAAMDVAAADGSPPAFRTTSATSTSSTTAVGSTGRRRP